MNRTVSKAMYTLAIDKKCVNFSRIASGEDAFLRIEHLMFFCDSDEQFDEPDSIGNTDSKRRQSYVLTEPIEKGSCSSVRAGLPGTTCKAPLEIASRLATHPTMNCLLGTTSCCHFGGCRSCFPRIPFYGTDKVKLRSLNAAHSLGFRDWAAGSRVVTWESMRCDSYPQVGRYSSMTSPDSRRTQDRHWIVSRISSTSSLSCCSNKYTRPPRSQLPYPPYPECLPKQR